MQGLSPPLWASRQTPALRVSGQARPCKKSGRRFWHREGTVTVDQFEQAGVPLQFRGPAGVSPRRPNAGAQILGSVPKKLPSIVFPRSLRIGAGVGELIV